MRIEEVTLLATVADHRKGPNGPWPQVAFAGRSNVGKSSLLNSMFGRPLAGVSKTPGKTRTINYYLVNGSSCFVDLPGYGFAKASQAERIAWGERVSAYLAEEPRLKLVVGLVDPRIPTSPLDIDLVGFARAAGRPLLVVMTKADRSKQGELARAADRLTRDLELERRPLAFSAKSGTGKKQILIAIGEALAH